ncbi:MAG: arginyl-tRNA synthetase [Candidatus Woesearchaeota archaeon]|nr:arginyl-tRNA synthetase [Candidatus Woesearchaeota archaeon]
MKMYFDKVKELVKKALPLELSSQEIQLEIPKDLSLGDIALPCFQFAKELRKAPQLIAKEISEKINPDGLISKVEAVGPYVNFYLNKSAVALDLIEKIKDNSLIPKTKNEKIMIEFLSPNLNKPLHIGHIRNGSLGESTSKILESLGNKVIRANLYNDRGMGVSETIYAYLYLSDKKEPDTKPDHFVGNLYVLFQKKKKEDPSLEEKAREILKRFEQNDPEIISVLKKLRKWVMEGYEETYKKFGYNFDVIYYESEIYEKGKDIVLDALKKGIFIKEDNAVVAPLEKYGLPNKTVLKSDGTTLYITQDIYLAKKKFEDFDLDKSIYVVASEQNLHFVQLFRICEMLGIAPVEKMHHLSYGMVLLPSGKMKSREGTVVDADEFFDEIKQLALQELSKRGKNDEELAKKIALSAINFYMLKIDPKKDFVFNPEESLSFEGQSGVYVQYTHARISSLIRKYEEIFRKLDLNKATIKDLTNEEEKMISLLTQFPNTVEEAATQYKPSIIANYLIKISETFNSYYHSTPILNSNNIETRILLTLIIKKVIEQGLQLLNIEPLEEI